MRGLLLSSVALAVMTAASVAADLPARAPAMAPAPMYAVPLFTWTGFYVGVNVGGASRDDNTRSRQATALPGATAAEVAFANGFNTAAGGLGRGSNDDINLTGGVQLGYNWQFGALVVGVEADYNALSRGDRNSGSSTVTGLNNNVFGFVAADLNPLANNLAVRDSGSRSGRGVSSFGTLRGRIGYAFGNTMIYATGGLAFAGGRDSNNNNDIVAFVDTNGNGVQDGPESFRTFSGGRRSGRNNVGYALGGGVEHAFSNNWSLKLEYLYVDLDGGRNRDLLGTTTAGPRRNDFVSFRGDRSEDNLHVVRVGLNYKFGGGARSSGPVVAAY